MVRPELVPGPRWTPPTDLPHVLVIRGRGEEKDYEVEHPAECARSCPWWPGAGDEIREALGFLAGAPPLILSTSLLFDPEEGTPNCYVEWEIQNAGLDSLAGELDLRPVDGCLWRDLPAGRYLIAGWYRPARWVGPVPMDPDGGLELLSRERPRFYDLLRPRAVSMWASRIRSGIRVGEFRVVVRGPKTRASFSERERRGCFLVPLSHGWRVVLERRSRWPRR